MQICNNNNNNNNNNNHNHNNNKLKISIVLFPDVIKSALQKIHVKLNTILNGRKVKKQNLKRIVKKKALD